MPRLGRGTPNRPIIRRALPGMDDVVVAAPLGVAAAVGFAPTIIVQVGDPGLGAASAAGFDPSLALVIGPGVGTGSASGFGPDETVVVTEGLGTAAAAGFDPSIVIAILPGVGAASSSGFGPAETSVITEFLGTAAATGFAPSVVILVGAGVGSASSSGFGPGETLVITEGLGVASAVGFAPIIVLAIPVTATGGIIYDGSITPTATVAVGACSGGILYGGSAVPQGGFVGTPLVRWRFDDPVDASAYIFEINPNAGGSAKADQLLTVVPTTAADGVPLIFAGDNDLLASQFSGVLRTQAQHDAFKEWFDKNRPVQLTDDLGRRSIVNLVSLSCKRASRAHSPLRQSYTVDYQILAQLDV